MVEIQFDPFFNQISKHRDFWIDPNPAYDSEDFHATGALLTSKFSHLADKSNIQHDRSLTLSGKNYEMNFYISAVGGGSSDSNGKSVNYSVQGLYTSISINVGDQTYQSSSGATRTDKAYGHFWVLHSLVGCDSVIRDELSAIAIRIPDLGTTTASVKILKAGQTEWQNLPEGTWRIEEFTEESNPQGSELSTEDTDDSPPNEYLPPVLPPIKNCQSFG